MGPDQIWLLGPFYLLRQMCIHTDPFRSAPTSPRGYNRKKHKKNAGEGNDVSYFHTQFIITICFFFFGIGLVSRSSNRLNSNQKYPGLIYNIINTGAQWYDGNWTCIARVFVLSVWTLTYKTQLSLNSGIDHRKMIKIRSREKHSQIIFLEKEEIGLERVPSNPRCTSHITHHTSLTY